MKKLLLIAGLVMSVQAISAGYVPQQQVDPGHDRLTTFEFDFSTYFDELQPRCRDLAERRRRDLAEGRHATYDPELVWMCRRFLKVGE